MVNLRDVTLDRQHRDTLASFAGVVAHDLFNPLSVVDGWTEALADEFEHGPVSPRSARRWSTGSSDAAAHMREFIADLMSYTIARDQSLRRVRSTSPRWSARWPACASERRLGTADRGRRRPPGLGRQRPGAPAARQPARQRDQVRRIQDAAR